VARLLVKHLIESILWIEDRVERFDVELQVEEKGESKNYKSTRSFASCILLSRLQKRYQVASLRRRRTKMERHQGTK